MQRVVPLLAYLTILVALVIPRHMISAFDAPALSSPSAEEVRNTHVKSRDQLISPTTCFDGNFGGKQRLLNVKVGMTCQCGLPSRKQRASALGCRTWPRCYARETHCRIIAAEVGQ